MEESVSGFGLMHIREEGAPLHPDDSDFIWEGEDYERQLRAYNEYHGEPS